MHPHAKAPWLNLVIAILTFGMQPGMIINSYQADGGWCIKTWALGCGISIFNAICLAFAWFFGLTLIFVILNYSNYWTITYYYFSYFSISCSSLSGIVFGTSSYSFNTSSLLNIEPINLIFE